MFYHVSIKTFKTQTFSKIINAFFEERIMNIENPGKTPVQIRINKKASINIVKSNNIKK